MKVWATWNERLAAESEKAEIAKSSLSPAGESHTLSINSDLLTEMFV